MKKLLCILCALALLTLSGCSLAKADSVDPGADILVGAFVSLDSIGYPGRDGLVEVISSETGWEIPGAEGVWVYVLPIYENQSLRYEASTDRRVDVGGVTAYVGGGMSWSAHLTLWNAKTEIVLHFNPLYRRGDGTLYAKPSIGQVVDTGLIGQGGGWTCTEESLSSLGDWSDQNWSTAVEIRYEIAIPAETYVLCRMDEQNRELSRQKYLPGELPEELEPQCSWLLLEKHFTDGKVERQAFGPETTDLTTLIFEETGLCCQQVTNLLWG